MKPSPRLNVADKFMILAVTTLLVMVGLSSCARRAPGDDWRPAVTQTAQHLFDWSAGGKPYHANACVVRASDGKTGSGTYVQFGGMTGVLTCQHVVGGKMTATFSDGQTLQGEPKTDKFGHDIAFFACKHPKLLPLNLAAKAPQPGERVEFVSRGGPRSSLRHWYGIVESDSEKLMVQANITPGDSGGGIVNAQGEVVGVSTDGQSTAAILLASGRTVFNPDPNYAKQVYERGEGWIVYAKAGSPGYGPVRKFLQRVRTQWCPDCPDGSCPPQGPGQYGDLYPPSGGTPPIAPPIPPPPDQYLPTPPTADVADLRIRIELLEKSLQGPVGPPGLPGKDGRDGKDGAPCDPALVIDSLQEKLPSAEQLADALFAKYGEALRGPPGKDGAAGRNGDDGAGAQASDSVMHAVLVVDRSASYWPRLSSLLERARERYHGIRIAAPPEFATELPAIVFYQDGKPIVVRKGEREVSHTLTALERGDLSFLQES